MGFDLRSDSGDEFWINNTGWRYLLTFAAAHGFCWPLKDDGDEYESLTADEAGLLANAVEHGMGEEPSLALAAKVSAVLTRLLVTPSDSTLFRDDPIELKPSSIEHWRDFVRFARKGGFSLSV
jgi:hypothetical protein